MSAASRRVFSLRDTQVREVMVPRSGMVTLPWR